MTTASPSGRSSDRPRPARFAAFLAAGVAIAVSMSGCSAGVAPSATTRLGPTLAPVGTANVASPASVGGFTSERHAYTVVLPEGWSTNEPPGAGGVHPDEPGVDTFKNGAHIFYVTVEEATGQPGTWTCAIVQHLEGPDHGLTVKTAEPMTVDGVAGKLSEFDLRIDPYRIHYLEVEVVKGARGYALSLESTSGDDLGDRALLDQLLDDFRFEDG